MLLRVDLNVPMENGKVSDATRIERVLPTIREIADKGGKVILLAHFGRPKGGPDAGEFAAAGRRRPSPSISAGPSRSPPTASATPREAAIAAMKDGDVLLLENTRFHKGEEKNDPAFVAELAKLGDLYVNDAFSAAHRAHASTEGVAHELPACAGRAMQAELDALTLALGNPDAPGGGDRRRRESFDQARPARQSRQEGRHARHRRRHGEHVPVRAKARRSANRSREKDLADTARAILDAGRRGQLQRSCCRSTR